MQVPANPVPIFVEILSVMPSNDIDGRLHVVPVDEDKMQRPFSLSRTAARKLIQMLEQNLPEE